MTLTTTPSFVVEMSQSPDSYYDIVISFYQGGVPQISKHKENLHWEGMTGSFRLTEEETQKLRHADHTIISVTIYPTYNSMFEVAKILKNVYYIYGEKLRVGFEDETTNVLVQINEYSAVSPIQVEANVLNALRDQYIAGNGIDIDENVISVTDLILDCDSSTDLEE